ncbi:unnamed protein product [Pichia kudriavzevii]
MVSQELTEGGKIPDTNGVSVADNVSDKMDVDNVVVDEEPDGIESGNALGIVEQSSNSTIKEEVTGTHSLTEEKEKLPEDVHPNNYERHVTENGSTEAISDEQNKNIEMEKGETEATEMIPSTVEVEQPDSSIQIKSEKEAPEFEKNGERSSNEDDDLFNDPLIPPIDRDDPNDEDFNEEDKTNSPGEHEDDLHDTVLRIENTKNKNNKDSLKIEAAARGDRLNEQTFTIVLPSYSSWFELSSIHDIERESLPEFFQGQNKSKTPEIYIKYRNFMVNSYRLNPNDYLSFTAVRRNLIGDSGALLRIHKFLTKWGIINYQVNPETRPQQIEPPYTGDFIVDYDTPRGMFPFESYKPPTEFPDLSHFKSLIGNKNQNETQTKFEEGEREGEPKLKKQRIIKADINKDWSEKSLQKLVDGVSQFKNDWYKIAAHVGDNKTAEECIIRFLQLPIEDKFLEDNKDLLGPLKYVPNLSFSSKENPIMSTLSFLANLVDTDVAAAASNRAIKVADKKLEKKLNRFKESEPTKEKTADDPLVDIKDAAVNAFGIIGARSHLFATFEEREMHRSLVNILQHQMKIVDMKLEKLNALEKEFELSKRYLEKKSDELLEEKLSIFKYNNAATSKLLQAVSLMESTEDLKEVDVEQVKLLIKQSKDILYQPPRKQLNILEEGGSDDAAENDNDPIKPVSFEAPMLYRYWSG